MTSGNGESDYWFDGREQWHTSGGDAVVTDPESQREAVRAFAEQVRTAALWYDLLPGGGAVPQHPSATRRLWWAYGMREAAER